VFSFQKSSFPILRLSFLPRLIGGLLVDYPLLFLVLLPVAQVVQAVAGAYILRKADIDPLFRRFRDIFWLILTVIIVSAIVPSLTSLGDVMYVQFFGMTSHAAAWSLRYTGTVFCLLIITPFVLRWFAKTRFSRTRKELIELIVVFGILITIDSTFFTGISTILGFPIEYILLAPLFWIALRLRPRFVTLALLITSCFAIASLYVGHAVPTPDMFSAHLFGVEELLIVLAVIFFVIVSLEENRRLNSNIILSQVASLENAVAQISSESNAKNDFIAVLAHELRNPLAPIVSAVELLKLKNPNDAEEIETLVMMEERLETVRRLLDDLLDISRITEGKVTLKRERINLVTVMRRAIMSTTHHMKERHQSITFKSTRESFVMYGDPVRIEQVFSNLITNASKYSHAGDHIDIAMREQDGNAQIIFTDTGIGIEPGALESIFTPFHQLGISSATQKGLGIGLALVRSFVEIHNGSISVSSAGTEHGSQFTVELPLLDEEMPSSSEERPATRESRATIDRIPSTVREERVGPHILVVDDNDAAAWGIGRILELKGCTVSYAYDGKQAIEETANRSPDIILLDMGLPDRSGYLVAKTIRAGGFRGRLIALTGFSTDDARAKGREAGIEYFVIKPAGYADLKRVIPELA
jgi:signal transduction histidine kinase